ncbi:helix-turn-helix domain-containing protein [Laceyella putida]|uniref:Helix-turn-helix domain-containing protein n=1 Tax=Laceyella putida TaxID=110101 RepID=A0ABW2RQZ2_9BACL
MSKKPEEQNFLFMAGQSKAERIFQDNFVLTDKESGFKIIKEHGTNAFTMWWILQSYCYGKGKAHAFPSLKTLSKLVKKSERTVQRWLDDLAKAKGIKIVPCFWEDTGFQSSNLYVLNHDFPEVPEWWDTFFQHGAIRTRDNQFSERPEPSKKAPDKNVVPIKSAPTKMSSPENQGSSDQDGQELNNEGDDKNVTPEIPGTTKMSPLENQGLEAKSGENPETQAPTNLSPQEEEETTSFQEEELNTIKKKNNNNSTYIDNRVDTDMGTDQEEKNVVVVDSQKSEIIALFEKKMQMKLSEEGFNELVQLTIGNLKANQKEISSESIVARLKEYIHHVDQYNRPFKTNGYIVLRNAIRDNYVYVNHPIGQPKNQYASSPRWNHHEEGNENQMDSPRLKALKMRKIDLFSEMTRLKREEPDRTDKLAAAQAEFERVREEIKKLEKSCS